MPPDQFTVIALIAAFNEEDVIGEVIAHLHAQDVAVYLIDNGSTDATLDIARRAIGHGVVGVETYTPSDPDAAPGYDWGGLLARKAALARELQADWFIHHDADEIREAPWAGMSLNHALRLVDTLGYNAVDFEVCNFWPTIEDDPAARSVVERLRYCEPAEWFDRTQIKCWKNSGQALDLVTSGGHDVGFEGRRVCPLRFIVRHYPIRSQEHGARKVFAERKPRFLATERQRGWHVQYDRFAPGDEFLRPIESLREFDPEIVRAQLSLRHRDVEALERTRDEADANRAAAEQRAAAMRDEAHAADTLRQQAEVAQAAAERRVEDAQAAADRRVEDVQAAAERRVEDAQAAAERRVEEARAAVVAAEERRGRAQADAQAAQERLAALIEQQRERSAEHAHALECLHGQIAELTNAREALTSQLAGAGAELALARTHNRDLADALDARAVQLDRTSAELAAAVDRVAALLDSRTWRWTAPLRRTLDFFAGH